MVVPRLEAEFVLDRGAGLQEELEALRDRQPFNLLGKKRMAARQVRPEGHPAHAHRWHVDRSEPSANFLGVQTA